MTNQQRGPITSGQSTGPSGLPNTAVGTPQSKLEKAVRSSTHIFVWLNMVLLQGVFTFMSFTLAVYSLEDALTLTLGHLLPVVVKLTTSVVFGVLAIRLLSR